MIRVEALSKHYRVHKRPPGFAAALRALVHRDYETVRAVNAISFEVQAGERVGFLGPNGAGKTTTLKMLSGLLHPSAGTLEVHGFQPSKRAHAFLEAIMLVMGQKQQLIWDLPPVETFELNRAIYGVPWQKYRRMRDELVQELGIAEVMQKPTRQLSLGERMKCELAAALIHEPKVLFLDEPTIGLDVTMQATVRAFIKRYNETHGATVLLTSHDMDDVAALCPRIIVIDAGRIVFDGALSRLVEEQRPEKRLSLHFSAPVGDEALEGLGRLVQRTERSVLLQVPSQDLKRTIEHALRTLPVSDLLAENAPLEEVLSSLFGASRG